MTVFEALNSINVNGHTEKKQVDNGKTELTYLSWPWAWSEVKKRFPDAHYQVVKDSNGLPYFSDPRTGIMVYTNVTIDNVTHEMWLPVMDGNNKAMKFEPYEIETKYRTITVKAATMFDINKTIMRCLTKNLAMFGLGLYIYAGEDLPEGEEPEPIKDKLEKTPEQKDTEMARRATIMVLESEYHIDNKAFGDLYRSYCKSVLKAENTIPLGSLTDEQFDSMVLAINEKLKKGVA